MNGLVSDTEILFKRVNAKQLIPALASDGTVLPGQFIIKEHGTLVYVREEQSGKIESYGTETVSG